MSDGMVCGVWVWCCGVLRWWCVWCDLDAATAAKRRSVAAAKRTRGDVC